MTDEEKRRAAQAITSIPYFSELFDEIEATALNKVINAEMNDDETRRNSAAEVRAIRKVRARLVSLGEETPVRRATPA